MLVEKGFTWKYDTNDEEPFPFFSTTRSNIALVHWSFDIKKK